MVVIETMNWITPKTFFNAELLHSSKDMMITYSAPNSVRVYKYDPFFVEEA